MRLTLSLTALLVVALAGCDAAGPEAAPAVTADASENAAVVDCELNVGFAARLRESGPFAVIGPVTQAGCAFNRNTGVLQYTIEFAERFAVETAEVVRGEETNFRCGYRLDGELLVTKDFFSVSRPSGTAKTVCKFHPPDPG